MKKEYQPLAFSVFILESTDAVIASGPEDFDKVVVDDFTEWWQR